MDYDEQYAKVDALFGSDPEATLIEYAGRLPEKATVLDIGAGQGRNSLYLARRGIVVDALEPSEPAARQLERIAAEERLPIRRFADSFQRFDPTVDHYSGILVFGLIPDLNWSEIDQLADRISKWTGKGSIVWLTGFTVQDPAYIRNPERRGRTYLEPGQILQLFPGNPVLHHWEGLGPEHRHVDGPPERHGMFEVVLQCP
jgi:tellurite methyltransferase